MHSIKHVTGLRTALIKRWDSKWSVDFKIRPILKFLAHQDLLISQYIMEFFTLQRFKTLKPVIKRSKNIIYIFVTIFRTKKTRRFFLVLKNNLVSYLESFTGMRIKIYYSFINNIFFNAAFLGQFVVGQIIKKHKPFRIFKSILRLHHHYKNRLRRSVMGIRYEIAGRINGVDRGRTLKFVWGSVPLNTLKQNISFYKTVAYTKEGTLGIKIWIAYKD